MKIYVLFHADIEDDRYVRKVFSSEELAEAAIDVPEILDWGRKNDGTRDTWTKNHSDSCCSVDSFDLNGLPDESTMSPQEERS